MDGDTGGIEHPIPLSPRFDPTNPYEFPRYRTIWRVAGQELFLVPPIAPANLTGTITGNGLLGGLIGITAGGITLTGPIPGLGLLGGTLTITAAGTIALVGSVPGIGTLTGALSQAWNLSGAVTGVSALTGDLTRANNLTATIAGTGTLAGALTIVATRPLGLLLALRTT